MSEPRKEPEKSQSSKLNIKRLSLFIAGVIIVGGFLVYYNNMHQPEPEPTQQNPPNVAIEWSEPVEEIKTESGFNVKDFDYCVDLLIGFVKLSPYPGEKLNSQDQLELNIIKSQYYDLKCDLVEEQLTSTQKYRNMIHDE